MFRLLYSFMSLLNFNSFFGLNNSTNQKVSDSNRELNLSIIKIYHLKNLFFISLSSLILYRLSISLNTYVGEVYVIILYFGIIISFILFYYYSEARIKLNFKVNGYPLWLLVVIGISGIFWLCFIPLFINKLLTKELLFMVETKYNVWLNENVVLHMDSSKERAAKVNPDRFPKESMSSSHKASGVKDQDLRSILRSDANKSQIINIETKGAYNTVQVNNSGENINNNYQKPNSNFLESEGDNASQVLSEGGG